ncbi:GNAT family N-acetyltransferase [Paenibacillus sp. SC116]|uniref:GNAT family N-acetyltransferase n=1 Tax=Paenibacillus sp. SC116 TaxID=2968986 RepID=UPI00215A6AEB|nr:GNAT family N-acetyltransferase [Paenibacillus sp. SC116]MCR8842217.1 GNAT family N-acetyltransferase [Paenibacillus sp. SC116]
MRSKQYEIIERLPTVMEHKTIWEAVGWGSVNIEMTERSIANSIYSLVVISDDHVIGMGRIVGDGAMYYYIQDVAVLPEYQKLGIGKQIVEKLINYISNHCVGAGFVGLFASQGKEPFYEQFGFKDYSPGMTGMFRVMEK